LTTPYRITYNEPETHGIYELSERDLEPFLAEVEADFKTREEAEAYVRSLWDVVCAFVDIAWGVDSVQFVLPQLVKDEIEGDA
jgi:hypothetical protein